MCRVAVLPRHSGTNSQTQSPHTKGEDEAGGGEALRYVQGSRGAASTSNTGRTTDPSTGLPSPSPPGGGGGGDRAEGSLKSQQVVRELWFIVVMAAVALLLLAVVLAVVLHKVGRDEKPAELRKHVLNKPHLTRERPPLVALPMQKRSPMAVYPPSNSVLFDTVPDTTSFSNSVTLKGFTMKIEEVVEAKCEPAEEAPPQGELSVGVLRRSVSQVMDGKPLGGDDDVWDPNISGHDSGMVRDPKGTPHPLKPLVVPLALNRLVSPLPSRSSSSQFMDDEEFVDTVKGFSTVRKEHTMFTDTNL
ncbi:unnamed protein product [Menidia menidia]|uniref:(Atlantic silverside) hypothetical protein n=1 Tax=Menidia menidia TaxID=238744 RepID=A0A8S4B1W4_9TELE|nr:unnamed protein product [Menidia menidia]